MPSSRLPVQAQIRLYTSDDQKETNRPTEPVATSSTDKSTAGTPGNARLFLMLTNFMDEMEKWTQIASAA